jgi:hypothetical protein
MTSMVNITDGKMAPFPGGVLMKLESGEVIGSVGVSGASGDEDEYCALHGILKAGIDKIKTLPQDSSLKPIESAVSNLVTQMETLTVDVKNPINFIIPPSAKFYNEASPELEANFKGLDFASVTSITLSANSYGTDACKWIANEVLSKCVNL